jgi:hypothetical protein
MEIFTKTRKIIKSKDGEGIETEYTVHPVGPILICMMVIVMVLFFV